MSVVKVEMRSLIPSAFASFVVNAGASAVSPSTASLRPGPFPAS